MMILIVTGCIMFGATILETIRLVLNMIDNHNDVSLGRSLIVAFMWASWLFNFMIFFKILLEK